MAHDILIVDDEPDIRLLIDGILCDEGYDTRGAPDSDGAIALLVRQAGDEVLISVVDNGVGLPIEDRARLTEPYVTHKPKGTGLGLAIVKKIMEDHGGRLLLDDRSDGPGAIATLVLPVSGPQHGPSTGEPGAGGPVKAAHEAAEPVSAEHGAAEKVPDGA